MEYSDKVIRRNVLELLEQRASNATICPSEALPVKLRKNSVLMDRVREVVQKMVAEDLIVITQKGKIVDPKNFTGPIRLKMK